MIHGCSSESEVYLDSNDMTLEKNSNSSGEMDSQSIQVITTETTFDNPFKCIGILHNQAMDSIKINRISINKIGEFTDEFTERHADMIFGLKKHLANYPVRYRRDIKSISKQILNGHKTILGKEVCDSLITKTSSTWQPYLNRMKSAIEKLRTETDVEYEFYVIDYTINKDNKLTIEDKSQLWAISAITRSSLEYNIASYAKTTTYDSALETAVKADFGGAVAGAVDYALCGSSITGLMFGPGGAVLCCGAYIVKSAILSSAVGVAFDFFW